MKNVFRINRRLEPGQYRLEDVFADIRTYGILQAVFTDTERNGSGHNEYQGVCRRQAQ